MDTHIFLDLLLAAVIFLIIFLIWLIVKAARTLDAGMAAINKLVGTTEEALQQLVPELTRSLASLRKATDNLNAVTDDAKVLSGSIREVGENVRQVAWSVKRVSGLIQNLSLDTASTMCSLKTGVMTGVEVFLKSLFRRSTP